MIKRFVILILLCIVAMLCADPQPRKSMPFFGDAVVPWYLNSNEGKWYPGACTDTGEVVFKLASTGTWSYSQEIIDWYSRKSMPPGALWGFDSTNKLFRPTPCDEQGRPFSTLQGTAECITAESIVLVPTATADAPDEDTGRMYFDSDEVDFLGWDGTSWRSFVTGTTTGVDLTSLEVTTNTTTETLVTRSESEFNHDQDADGDFIWNSEHTAPCVHFDADAEALGLGGPANVSYSTEITGGWIHLNDHVFIDGEITQDAGNVVFNETGASYDFRVENGFNENVFCSDSSDNALGIMCDPDGNHSLEVSGNMSVSDALDVDYLKYLNAGMTIEIQSNNSNAFKITDSSIQYIAIDSTTGSPQMKFVDGPLGSVILMDTSGMVVNNSNTGVMDFRVKGDTDNNLLFADVGDEAVGFGVDPDGDSIVEINGTCEATIFIGDGSLLTGLNQKTTAEVETIIDAYGYNSTEIFTKAETDATIEAYVKTEATKQRTREIWVNGNREDSYTEDGSIQYPYKTIQAALNTIAQPTSALAELAQRDMIYIAAGCYDEDLNITVNLSVSLIGMGPVVLGDGANNYYASTTPRDITINFDDTQDYGKRRQTFYIGTITPSTTSTTHPSYGCGFIVSGDFYWSGGVSSSKEFHANQLKVQGDMNGSGNVGNLNMYIYNCMMDNGFNMSSANLIDCFNTEFDETIEVATYGRIVQCEISNGIDGTFSDYVPPGGFFDCKWKSGDISGAGSHPMDSESYASFLDNGGTFTGGGSVSLLSESAIQSVIDSTGTVTTEVEAIIDAYGYNSTEVYTKTETSNLFHRRIVDCQIANGASNVFTLNQTANVGADDAAGILVLIEGSPQVPTTNYTYATATNQVTIVGTNLPAGAKVTFIYNY